MLNQAIQVVEEAWARLPQHHPNVRTDVFVVMPNHVHGIVWLAAPVVKQPAADGIHTAPGSLSTIVRSFKSSVSRELRLQGLVEGTVWQQSFWDRVIRNEDELNRIRQYIAFNPIAWEFDHENPGRNSDAEYDRAWSWLERAAS